jgi:hypothetical protein
MELYLLYMEAMEEGAYFGNVIQRKHELATHFPEPRREFLEIGGIEVVAVQLSAPIWGIEIEKRRWPVEARQDFVIRSALDLHPFQSLMGLFNELREALQIESGRLNYVPVVNGISHEARKAILQNVQIPCGSLDVREHRRISRPQEIEPLAAHDYIAEVPDQFLVVLLADAVEIDDFAVEVVQYLDARRLLVEEHLRAARERFYIGSMFGKYLNHPLCQSVLPTYVR